MIALARTLTSHRDLIFNLALRELKLKYKTATLGFLWSLITPLCLTLIFSVIFTRVIPMNIERFPLFLVCALFPWQFLHHALTAGTQSIVQSGNLIKKLVFPREAIPIALVTVELYHLGLALLLFLGVLLALGRVPDWRILWLPYLVGLQTLMVLGLVCGCAAWHTFFRDVKYLVELVLLAWFYVTPIFYPLSLLDPLWARVVLVVNPMAGFVVAYRDVALGLGDLSYGLIAYLTGVSLVVCWIGLSVFRRSAGRFADVV